MDVVAVPHVGTSSSLSPSRRQGAGQLIEPARFDSAQRGKISRALRLR